MRPFLLTLVLLLSRALAAENWPPGFVELEELALREPGPGKAFGHVCQIAAGSRQLPELRARWEERGDVPALILLGWLEHESGKQAGARALFARAAAIDPNSYEAQCSVAWSLEPGDVAAVETEARRALALARTDAQRSAVVRLVPDRLAARGDAPAARRFLRAMHADSPDASVRLELIPRVIHAALAEGKVAEVLEQLEKAKADGSWESAASYAAACLELGEPARAFREAKEALAKHADAKPLRKIAMTAARRSDFITDFAEQSLALLGQNPTAGEAGLAMDDLIDAQAINAIKTIAQRFPAQLSEGASLWRRKLPVLARLGVLEEVRAALEGTPGGSWEKDLALAEAATLERDWQKASERFWSVMRADGSERPLAVATMEAGNRGVAHYNEFPLEGIQLYQRHRETRPLYGEAPAIFTKEGTESTWNVVSFVDGRDYALVCLHRLSLLTGSETEFLEQLKTVSAKWPVGERLLAEAIVGRPAGIVEQIQLVASDEPEVTDAALLGFAANQLAFVKALPWLDPESNAKARSIRLPERPEKVPTRAPASPWRGALAQCYEHFLNGRLDKAATAFSEALPLLRRYPVGDLEAFYNSLTGALDRVPTESRNVAAGMILEWMARESATRLDLPAAPDYTVLTRFTEMPLRWNRMFVPPGGTPVQIVGHVNYTPFPGGWVTPAQSEMLAFWWSFNRESLESLDPLSTSKLTGTERQILASYYAVMSAWTEDSKAGPKVFEILDKEFSDPCGRILGLWKVMRSPGRVPPLQKLLVPVETRVPISSGPAVARAILESPNNPVVEELAKLPLASTEQACVLEKVDEVSAQKLALQWLPAAAAKVEPPDGGLMLRKLILLAETDQATSLAKDLLRTHWNSESSGSFARSLAVSNLAQTRHEALKTLDTLGELRSWMDESERAAKKDPQSLNAQWALFEAAQHAQMDNPVGGERMRKLLKPAARELMYGAASAICAVEPPISWISQNQFNATSEERASMGQGAQDFLKSSRSATLSWNDALTLIMLLPADQRAGAVEDLLSRRNGRRELPNGGFGSLIELIESLSSEELNKDFAKMIRFAIGIAHPAEIQSSEFGALSAKWAGVLDRDSQAALAVAVIQRQAEIGAGTLAFPFANSWGDSWRQSPIREFLEAADRQGILPTVMEKLDGNGPFARDLLLAMKAVSGDPKIVDDARARFGDHEERPIPNAVLDLLAEPLSEKQESRELADKMLEEMEPYRFGPEPLEAVPRIARHARLGVNAVSANASKWIASTIANMNLLSHSARLALMPDLLEACARANVPAFFTHAAKAHADIYARGEYDLKPLLAWMQKAIERGDRKLVGALATAAFGSARMKNDEITRKDFESNIRYFAARSGDFRSSAPAVWLLPKAPGSDPTERRVAWDFGWNSSIDPSATILTVAGARMEKDDQTCAVELYWGQDSGRFEKLQRIEGVKPSGSTTVRLPPQANYLLISVATTDRTVLGSPQVIRQRAEAIPLGEKLQLPDWKGAAGGPHGTFFASSKRVSADPNAGTTVATWPVPENARVVLSAWVRHGGIKVAVLDAKGTVLDHLDVPNPSTVGWTLIGSNFGSSENFTARHRLPSSAAKLEVRVPFGTEISACVLENVPVSPAKQ